MIRQVLGEREESPFPSYISAGVTNFQVPIALLLTFSFPFFIHSRQLISFFLSFLSSSLSSQSRPHFSILHSFNPFFSLSLLLSFFFSFPYFLLKSFLSVPRSRLSQCYSVLQFFISSFVLYYSLHQPVLPLFLLSLLFQYFSLFHPYFLLFLFSPPFFSFPLPYSLSFSIPLSSMFQNSSLFQSLLQVFFPPHYVVLFFSNLSRLSPLVLSSTSLFPAFSHSLLPSLFRRYFCVLSPLISTLTTSPPRRCVFSIHN